MASPASGFLPVLSENRNRRIVSEIAFAGVVKSVDTGDLKSPDRKVVRVRVPPSAFAPYPQGSGCLDCSLIEDRGLLHLARGQTEVSGEHASCARYCVPESI
jgi:hypothetical protein